MDLDPGQGEDQAAVINGLVIALHTTESKAHLSLHSGNSEPTHTQSTNTLTGRYTH